MATTQNQVLLDLSYLLGETSIPSPTPVDRQTFIQRALERAYRAYNFNFDMNTATVSISSGVGTLPADAGPIDPKMDVRILGNWVNSQVEGPGEDIIFEQIPYEQQNSFGAGDYKYWLLGTPGGYTINTNESGNTSLTQPFNVFTRYTQVAPTINASISTPFPSSMCIARGALVYYRQAEDPQADISQLEALFQQELEEIVANEIRNRPLTSAVTRHQKQGTYTGDIDIRYFPAGF